MVFANLRVGFANLRILFYNYDANFAKQSATPLFEQFSISRNIT